MLQLENYSTVKTFRTGVNLTFEKKNCFVLLSILITTHVSLLLFIGMGSFRVDHSALKAVGEGTIMLFKLSLKVQLGF